MDNCIITEEVLENMPNEDIFSKENNEYFKQLYDEFIAMALTWDN